MSVWFAQSLQSFHLETDKSVNGTSGRPVLQHLELKTICFCVLVNQRHAQIMALFVRHQSTQIDALIEKMPHDGMRRQKRPCADAISERKQQCEKGKSAK